MEKSIDISFENNSIGYLSATNAKDEDLEKFYIPDFIMNTTLLQ